MLKRIISLVAILFFVLPVCLVLLAHLAFRSERVVLNYLLPFISEKSGQKISAQAADVRLLSGVKFKGLRYNCASEQGSCAARGAFALKADTFDLNYDLWELFKRRLRVTSLTSDGLEVRLRESPKDQPAEAPADKESVKPPSEDQPESDSPWIKIMVTQANIIKGALSYHDRSQRLLYEAKDVAISIPEADSHGESSVSLNANVSLDLPDQIKISGEKLSVTGALKRSRFFLPERLDLKVAAGSAKPDLLELDGQLIFGERLRELRSIVIRKLVTRASLTKILGVSTGPVADFEYEASGDYSLDTPARGALKIDVTKMTLAGAGDSDLKGSNVQAKLVMLGEALRVEGGKVAILNRGAPVLNTDIDGEFAFNPKKRTSKLNARAGFIDLDQVQALIDASGSRSEPAAIAATSEAAPSSDAKPTSSQALSLPLVEASLLVEQVKLKGVSISGAKFDLSIPNNRTVARADLSANFPGEGRLTLQSAVALDEKFSVKANASKIDVLPIAALAQGKGELLEGNLDSLDINLSGASLDPRKTLSGHLRSNLSRFIVPSTLQQQVPFNILFLPLDVLITVFGGTINAILPASISSISDGIRQVLDDAGRLGIDKGVIDLSFDNGAIACKQVEIDTKNLPDFTFKGKVTREDKLDFTVFIALLKLNLPLPIAGTLSTPLPDVVYLGPEIIRGLGLSIGNITGGLIPLNKKADK
jgi:hypothetical protein